MWPPPLDRKKAARPTRRMAAASGVRLAVVVHAEVEVPGAEVDGHVAVQHADLRRGGEADLEHRALDERAHGQMGPVLAEQLRHEPLDPVARHVQVEVLDRAAVDLVLDRRCRAGRRMGSSLAIVQHIAVGTLKGVPRPRVATARQLVSTRGADGSQPRSRSSSPRPAIVFFIAAVRMRLFGRVRHGFLIALVVAVAGAGLVTASFGLWGFVQGERILFGEFVDQMQTLGEVVAKEVRRPRRDDGGARASRPRDLPRPRRANPARVRETIAAVQAFDPTCSR